MIHHRSVQECRRNRSGYKPSVWAIPFAQAPSVIKCKLPSHDTTKFIRLRCRGELGVQWRNNVLRHVIETNGAFIVWVNRNAH